MTTFRLDDSHGPGTHVFLIGVGHYPHLKGGGGTPQLKKQNGMGQLSSTPISAREFLKWVDTTLENPDAPLKSIEVLLSEPDPQPYTDAKNFTAAIAHADRQNVLQAAQLWFDRLDSHEDNVGIFYFCGHGVGDGVHTQLLLRDYGATAVPMEGAINFNGFRLAMGSCNAKKQVYFVDACRVVDATLLVDPNQMGTPLLPANVTRVFGGANPAFFSAKHGEPAFGQPNGLTYFTQALLDSLNKFGVYRVKGSKWMVKPQQLQMAIAALMSNNPAKPECTVDGLVGTGFQIHQLNTRPHVLLDVFLSLPEANDTAKITVVSNGVSVTRDSIDHPWRTVVEHGNCDLSAAFPQGSPYAVTPKAETIFPPLQEVLLEVQ